MLTYEQASDKVIIALDCSRERAFELADMLAGKATWVKVGMTLFYAEGPGHRRRDARARAARVPRPQGPRHPVPGAGRRPRRLAHRRRHPLHPRPGLLRDDRRRPHGRRGGRRAARRGPHPPRGHLRPHEHGPGGARRDRRGVPGRRGGRAPGEPLLWRRRRRHRLLAAGGRRDARPSRPDNTRSSVACAPRAPRSATRSASPPPPPRLPPARVQARHRPPDHGLPRTPWPPSTLSAPSSWPRGSSAAPARCGRWTAWARKASRRRTSAREVRRMDGLSSENVASPHLMRAILWRIAPELHLW